jgi:hypothetical protein
MSLKKGIHVVVYILLICKTLRDIGTKVVCICAEKENMGQGCIMHYVVQFLNFLVKYLLGGFQN